MRLLVSTPTAVVVDADDVRHVRAEDLTGAFGILPGHTAFLTVLAISVITWRNAAGTEHHVAVRGGVMTVRDGAMIQVATRQAVTDDDLEKLAGQVLARFREEAVAEEQARLASAKLHLAAIRHVRRYLQAGNGGKGPAAPPRFPAGGAAGTTVVYR